jgi:hypothetical protein
LILYSFSFGLNVEKKFSVLNATKGILKQTPIQIYPIIFTVITQSAIAV